MGIMPSPRSKKRGDFREIRHLHILSDKVHIPLDRKYIRYVPSDAWRKLRKRKKSKRDREKDK